MYTLANGRDSILTMPKASPTPPLPRLALLLAILVGFALRLLQLNRQSLWYDETVSAYLASLPLPAMVQHTARDIHPPGYYLFLALWQRLVTPYPGHGLEFLYIWPSVFFGLLIVALLWPLARRALPPAVATLAVWLGALHPFLIWYSQEVRMYALGGFLALLCLWAVVRFLDAQQARAAGPDASSPRSWGWLAIYSLAAAAGLYVLYYLLFWLAALNLAVLWALLAHRHAAGRATRRSLVRWLLAQFAVLLLWLPWLPIFVRQAVDPPVPPWRQPWTSLLPFLNDFGATLASLAIGQSMPAWTHLAWALLFVALAIGFFRYTKDNLASAPSLSLFAGIVTLATLVGAGALIFVASLLITPLYHIRYFAAFAPAAALVAAGGLAYWWRIRHWLGAAAALVLVGGMLVSLTRFWTDPLYISDDHRQAVADLAQRWRPGDAILINAGWVYPALYTYWPRSPSPDQASLPPPLAPPTRISDYTKGSSAPLSAAPIPIILTGAVDGAASLGWGLPTSDFFALSAHATQDALAHLSTQAKRIWHYRLYDTVNDPHAVIRDWFASEMLPLTAQTYPGDGYLRVELYAPPAVTATTPLTPLAEFSGALNLHAAPAPPTHPAGSTLYTDLTWRAEAGLAALPAPLAVSVRLYDPSGVLSAQTDAQPLPPTSTWLEGEVHEQPVALPIPATLTPGPYTLELILYRTDDLTPLPATLPDGSTTERVRLGPVEITPPAP